MIGKRPRSKTSSSITFDSMPEQKKTFVDENAEMLVDELNYFKDVFGVIVRQIQSAKRNTIKYIKKYLLSI